MARKVLVALLLAYFVLAVYYGLVTPVNEGPDEYWHVGYVKYLADGHGLPILSVDRPDLQESHQPPLYYAIGAAATFWIDTHDLPDLLTFNPHWGVGGRTREYDNKNVFVHGWPQERFPYSGAALAVHVVRVLSALMGVGALSCVYLLARELLAARPGAAAIALCATAFVAFNPQYLFLSGTVNNDDLVVLLCALGLWLIARTALGRAQPAPWLLGVVIGLGMLAKWSAGPLLPAAWVALWGRAPSAGEMPEGKLRRYVRDVAVLTVPVLVIAGWWYVRNQVVYGDPLALARVEQIFETRDPVPTVWQAIAELPTYEPSFWGRFGWENIPPPDWVDLYTLALDRLALVGLALLGLRWLVAWRRGRGPVASGEALALAALGVFGLILLALFIQWVRTTFPVGRHLFPGLPLVGLGLAVGLVALTRIGRPRWEIPPWAVSAALPVLIAAAVIAPAAWIAPAYYAPPPPPAVELAAMTPVAADVGGTLRLLGYSAAGATAPGVCPGGSVTITLYWQAIAPADRDWTVFVHLLGPDGQPITQRVTYPAFGRIATRFVVPGQMWSETYALAIPNDLAVPVTGLWSAGLFDERTGERARTPAGNTIGLQTVAIHSCPAP